MRPKFHKMIFKSPAFSTYSTALTHMQAVLYAFSTYSTALTHMQAVLYYYCIFLNLMLLTHLVAPSGDNWF
jgi:hypothetical protein